MRYIHTSHKTAAKKLENVKWTEDLTPEEIAQSDENTAQACDVVREVCGRKKIGDSLTRYALGLALCYPDNGLAIAERIGKMRKKECCVEDFGEKMDKVVG